MSSIGASATWTMNSLSARMSPMLADGIRRASEWNASEHQPDAGMVDIAHQRPGVAVVVHMPPPGQRLVSQPALPCAAASSPSSCRSSSIACAVARAPAASSSSRAAPDRCRAPPSPRTCASSARTRARAAARAFLRDRGTAGTWCRQARGRHHRADRRARSRARKAGRSRRSRRRHSLPSQSRAASRRAPADRNGGDRGLHSADTTEGAANSVKLAAIRAGSALRPVNISNASAAWCTAMPLPSSVRHPLRRAAASRSVSSGK